MSKDKKKALEKAGWLVEDSPQDFLGLSDAEMAVIDARVVASEGRSVLAPNLDRI